MQSFREVILMNKKAQLRKVNTRKIIDHAEALFAEKGFSGASTQEIADSAGLPKSNIHYYFNTKQELYTAVLNDILSDWMHDADIFQVSDDPELALRAYIRKKMEHSFSRPLGSRVWAMEIIQGGAIFGKEIKSTLIKWDREIVQRLQVWIDEGKLQDTNPQALLNMIWATTQYYADFEYQVIALNGGRKLSLEKRQAAIENVCNLIVGGAVS